MVTLATAQLERDRIKALQARNAFETAFENTLPAETAQQEVDAVQDKIHQAWSILKKRIGDAVAVDADETQLHFFMSDVVHDWLSGLSQTVLDAMGNTESAKAFSEAIKPKPLLTVSQWAERYRMLETGTNMPGPWRNYNAPHTIEIMDAMSEHSPVEEVVFKKCSGVSGTEIINNVHGYWLHHVGNKNFMHTVPTLDLRDRVFNPNFKKMVKETPVLSELIDFNSRDASATKEMIETKHGLQFHKIGANSAESARILHLPYYTGDEISAYRRNLGGEGDTLTLFENRQKTFSRSKRLYVSTPTTKGFCNIDDKYEQSDKRIRLVPCPHCGHMHQLEFKHFKFQYDPNDIAQKVVNDAWFECPKCHARIDEHHKTDILQEGRAMWKPTNPAVKNRYGYTINAFYIQFGLGKTWKQIAQIWVDAQGDDFKLQAFVNTYLGEVWEEKFERVEASVLLSRLETFPDDLPIEIRVAGVDVQKDRLELTITDFEKTEESWSRKHIILSGDTELEEVWYALEHTLDEYEVDICGIDAGYRPDRVYSFCLKHKWCYPTKGIPGMARPLIEDDVKRKQRLRKRRKKGMAPEPIGVDQGKSLILARLKLSNPTSYEFDKNTGEITHTKRESQPGYLHFANDTSFDDEYFLQLTAESLVTKKRAGREIQEWVKTRPRNEALDCMVICLAVYRLSKTVGIKKRRNSTRNNNTQQDNGQTKPKTKARRRSAGTLF